MAVPIVVPELGLDDPWLRISCWLVETGEHVEEGDRLVELVLPGTTFDIPSPARGRLSQIEKSFDAEAAPGDVVGWIDEEPAL